MDISLLEKVRGDRYNTWGEQQPLVSCDSQKNSSAQLVMFRKDLTNAEKSTFYLHNITGCRGLEFVGISNAKLDRPVRLLDGIILFPCFLQSTVGCSLTDPKVRASVRMEQTGRFIYDGWLPIQEMNEDVIRYKIRILREILGTFSLISGGKFEWMPKYSTAKTADDTHYFSENEIKTLEGFATTIDGLASEDRRALLRSIGWLSECISLQNPESKFLFAVLAIESLCTYIEKEAQKHSPLQVLALEKKGNAERKAERNACIHATLDDLLSKDPTRAIESAYFDCLKSIKATLQQHLTNIFCEDDDDIVAFFEKGESGFSLYELRHTIAHGSHDLLSESERSRIGRNAYKVERFAMRYIWYVFNTALNFFNESSTIQAFMPMGPDMNSIISSRSMYRGPVDMALLYIR